MALIGHWPLNGNENDVSGNGNHGTLVGTPVGYSEGKTGLALEFTSAYINCGPVQDSLFMAGHLTLAFWIYVNALPAAGQRRGIMQTVYGGEFALNIGETGSLQYYYGSSGIQGAPYTSPWSSAGFIEAGRWMHVALVRDMSDGTGIIKFYKDGTLMQTFTVSTTYTPVQTVDTTTFPLKIGVSYTGILPGKLNDVRIYDHALSTKEVKELSRAKILHYKFDHFQEPTTNQYVDGDYASGTFHPVRSLATETAIVSDPTKVFNGNVIKFMPRASNQYHGKDITVAIGDKYSASVWCYVSSDYDGTLLRLHCEQGYSYNVAYDLTKKGTWQKLKLENKETTTTNARILVYILSAFTTGFALFREVQFEKKDHATDFAPGSRSGTIKDCSGHGNDSNIDLSTSPQWTENGCTGSGSYYFSGTGNYKIDTGFGYGIDPTSKIFSLSFWAKPTVSQTTVLASSSQVGNANARFYVGLVAGTWDIGIQTSAWSSSTKSYTINEWQHVCVTMDGSLASLYVNGEFVKSKAYTPYTLLRDIYLGIHDDSYNYIGYVDDVRIYATALSSDEISNIYKQRGSIDSLGNLYLENIEETKYKPPILDYHSWNIGSSGSQTGFTQNGDGNSIVEYNDPFGKSTAVWQTLNNDIDSNADGGWKSSTFPVDNTKLYRFSTWVRRDAIGNGSFYFGCYGYGSVSGVYSNNDGVTISTNPYFNSRRWGSFPLYQWILAVGHVYPYMHTQTGIHEESGYYDINGNKIANTSMDFRWLPETTTARHRSYLYYSTDPTTHQLWCYPRVDICDGTEPSLQDLLNGIDSRTYDYIDSIDRTKCNSLSISKNITRISNISEVGLVDGLVGYFPLKSNANDYSGVGNNGAESNTKTVAGLDQQAMSFNGTDSRVLFPGDGLGDTVSALSISCWVKMTVDSDYMYIIHRGISSAIGDSIYWIGTDGSNKICGAINGNYVSGQTSIVPDPNIWYNIVLTWDGSLASVYIDGNLEKQYSTSLTNTVIGSMLGFGNSNAISPTRWLDGKIQNVRIYNKALSQKDVSLLYNISNPEQSQRIIQTNNGIVYIKKKVKEV
jgi:hypothetical protein